MNHEMPSLLAIFINWFPMLLIFGVWLFFLVKIRQRGGVGEIKNVSPMLWNA